MSAALYITTAVLLLFSLSSSGVRPATISSDVHQVSAAEPPLIYQAKKPYRDDSTAKGNRYLALGVGLGLGVPILAGVVYLCYYIYRQNQAAVAQQAEQQLQMVQQTLVRRALVESFPLHIVPDGTVYECPVCLEEFAEGSNLRLLPSCNHIFCIDCIDLAWADVAQTPQCPLCRHVYGGVPPV